MSVLNNTEIYKRLKSSCIIKTKYDILDHIKDTKNRFINFITSIETHYFKKANLDTNPLLWQIGHIVYFYLNLTINKLSIEPKIIKSNLDYILINKYNFYIVYYDSYKTPLEYRFGEDMLEIGDCIKYYNSIFNVLETYIKKKYNNNLDFISNIDSYIIMLGLLHNEMHTESIIFTYYNLSGKIKNFNIDYKECDILLEKHEMIKYNGGVFLQGSNINDRDNLIFDNEMPSFTKKINSFSISKYPITEYQYLCFVKNNGYNNSVFWSINGWKWKLKNNILMPKYWATDISGSSFYKEINNKKYSLFTNLPIIYISYYEAEPYCLWAGGRLPTESEYEYISTNKGTTKFPWGNKLATEKYCNINYKNYLASVLDYKLGNNEKNVSQLIGNIWEWCSESIYPYDGFIIDPIYREMSYPFFGFKKICKGGSFAVPNFLIHPKYRNAQYPNCREQFIGFRIIYDDLFVGSLLASTK